MSAKRNLIKRLTIVHGFRPKSKNLEFGKKGCHLKGHLKRSRTAQISALWHLPGKSYGYKKKLIETVDSLAVDGDGSVARLALNPLQLIDEVDDGLGVLGRGELGPASEVELGHYARVLWLGGGGEGGGGGHNQE